MTTADEINRHRAADKLAYIQRLRDDAFRRLDVIASKLEKLEAADKGLSMNQAQNTFNNLVC